MTRCITHRATFTAVGLILLLLPVSLHAGTVLRAGEAVAVTTEQTVAGDFYAAGGEIDLSGTVAGDALAAAGAIRHHGTTTADLHLAGGSIALHGVVGDDARLAGVRYV